MSLNSKRSATSKSISQKPKRLLIWAAAVMAALFVLLLGNRWIVPAQYEVRTAKSLPGGQLKIAVLSDMHGDFFESRRMFSLLESFAPDLIAVTGDIFTRGEYDEESLKKLSERLCALAPTFYVSGNHEAAGGYLHEIEQTLSAGGVEVLSNRRTDFCGIAIVGIEDYAYFTAKHSLTEASALLSKTLNALTADIPPERFTLLLSHRPDDELVAMYADCGADLTLSGHTHGGIIRLPFLGGLYSQNGFFPKYDGGAFPLEGGGCLIISRGLGNGRAAFRIGNPPEVCLITVSEDS